MHYRFIYSYLTGSVSANEGYEGQSFTIKCPYYIPPANVNFVWRKWKNGKYVDVASYVKFMQIVDGPYYYGDLGNGRASLSKSNQDLTITSLQLFPINDEARYQCHMLHHVRDLLVQVNGKSYNYY